MAAADLLRLSLASAPGLVTLDFPRLLLPNFLLLPRKSLRRPCLRSPLAKSADFAVSVDDSWGHRQPRPGSDGSLLLDVSGMMCGACVSRVRSILSADARVESAVVNMLTETAAVRLRSGASDSTAGAAEELARRLTECGFPSKRRELGLGVGENVRKWKEMAAKKEQLLVKSRNRVAFAWTLVALCCGSHATHILHSLGIHVAHGRLPPLSSPLLLLPSILTA